MEHIQLYKERYWGEGIGADRNKRPKIIEDVQDHRIKEINIIKGFVVSSRDTPYPHFQVLPVAKVLRI